MLPFVIYQSASLGSEGSKPRYGAPENQQQLQSPLIAWLTGIFDLGCGL